LRATGCLAVLSGANAEAARRPAPPRLASSAVQPDRRAAEALRRDQGTAEKSRFATARMPRAVERRRSARRRV
jgi:hypothetical protein